MVQERVVKAAFRAAEPDSEAAAGYAVAETAWAEVQPVCAGASVGGHAAVMPDETQRECFATCLKILNAHCFH